MSIRGLTDRGSAFPEIGFIRKGGKKVDPKKPGPDLDYFRVELDEKDPRSAQFLEIYGDHPTDIHIFFPFNEIERNWDAWYEAYTAGRMVARSDGAFFLYLVDVKTGERVVVNGVDKNGLKVPHREIVGSYAKQSGGEEVIRMKPTGRLKVAVPELHSLAYLTVHTTSIYDIMNISSQLEAIQDVNGGRIAGVPLTLRRRKKMISTPDPNDKTKRVRRAKSLISIEADPEWVKKMLIHMKHLALPGNGLNLLPETIETEETIKSLPAGSENEDEDEAETYGDEIDGQAEDTPSLAEAAEELGGVVLPGLDEARNYKTPKGTPLGTLSAAQLAEIIRIVNTNVSEGRPNPGDEELATVAGICLAALMPENQ